MFRVDKTGLPTWFYELMNLDLVNNAYHGLLRLYHTHNNPLVHSFIGTIMDNVLEARDQGNQTKQNSKQEGITTKNLHAENNHFENHVDEEILENDSVLIEGINKLRNTKKFLKVAYRWQYYAFLVRNPKMWEFRKVEEKSQGPSEKEDEAKHIVDLK